MSASGFKAAGVVCIVLAAGAVAAEAATSLPTSLNPTYSGIGHWDVRYIAGLNTSTPRVTSTLSFVKRPKRMIVQLLPSMVPYGFRLDSETATSRAYARSYECAALDEPLTVTYAQSDFELLDGYLSDMVNAKQLFALSNQYLLTVGTYCANPKPLTEFAAFEAYKASIPPESQPYYYGDSMRLWTNLFYDLRAPRELTEPPFAFKLANHVHAPHRASIAEHAEELQAQFVEVAVGCVMADKLIDKKLSALSPEARAALTPTAWKNLFTGAARGDSLADLANTTLEGVVEDALGPTVVDFVTGGSKERLEAMEARQAALKQDLEDLAALTLSRDVNRQIFQAAAPQSATERLIMKTTLRQQLQFVSEDDEPYVSRCLAP